MTYLDIETKIIERLQAIEGISDGAGQVRAGYQRAITKEDFEELFQVNLESTEKPVSAWLVIWVSATPTRSGAPTSTIFVDHTFSILGFKSYNKDSDRGIRLIAERIMEEFATLITLGLHNKSVSDTVVEDSTVSIVRFDQDMLGPVLTSFCELRITARERRMPVVFRQE